MDFRPISLCNMTYKIMMKIIALRIKPSLAEMVTKEQFAFLPNMQIMGVIGIAQRMFAFNKNKKRNALILKMDLIKAYDWVDWGFLCMLLLQIGLPLQVTEWIMACVSTVKCVILVNGKPTPFFSCGRGLRQGFPLSPLLFLLYPR
jgi:hypothetical protein